MESVSILPHPLDLFLSVWGHGYNVPPFVDLEYIWLLHCWKYIINSEELFPLPWVIEPLCSLIYCPSLSWLVSFPPLYIYIYHFSFCDHYLCLFLPNILIPYSSIHYVWSTLNFNLLLLLLSPWIQSWQT